MMVRQIVGASVPRKEGWDKVTGAARYVDDMVLPGMLYGATVRSTIASGKIKKISCDTAVAWNEYVVVSAKDIPGKNCIALILDDQPCLASEAVNHPEEPILLLAHADRHKLRKAVEAVAIEYEPFPPKRRTSSRASISPARRSSSTSKTTESSRRSTRRMESPFGARCNARTTCTKR